MHRKNTILLRNGDVYPGNQADFPSCDADSEGTRVVTIALRRVSPLQ